MSKINYSNLKKAYYYLKRNGLRSTYFAALERFATKTYSDYKYFSPVDTTLKQQGAKIWSRKMKFSILVPAYHTKEEYLRAMIESVLSQSYTDWELIIADAGARESDAVGKIAATYMDNRIIYLPLSSNDGISVNTNAALLEATGDYIGLLDHDDLLTPDALYEMALQIEASNGSFRLLYSDEDKCNETAVIFYEPHIKTKFNLDLILSNNYFCHFMVMEASLMKALGFRKEYDGAQDYDLVLRGVYQILGMDDPDIPIAERLMQQQSGICHVNKVLYHWRCHMASTAENPQSKLYAYEAGKRALEDFRKRAGWSGTVVDTKHLGFYRMEYNPDILKVRKDIGIIGGSLVHGHKITGGMIDEHGMALYKEQDVHYSGYMHRASLRQEAYAVDVRCMRIRPELQKALQEVTEDDFVSQSIEICKAARRLGYRVVWDPMWIRKQ